MTDEGRHDALFRQALGPDFDALPEPVRALHRVQGRHVWSGEARVTRGSSFLARLLCGIFGFPPRAERTPVNVTIERCGDIEVWQRNFGGKRFETVLGLAGAPGSGVVQERFGLMAFDIFLERQDGGLAFPVGRSYLLNVPLPRRLLPVSETLEFADNGRFRFDVKVSVPGAGMLVHYRGWLEPVAA
ncbi:DUF4166 domain-containing protein [Roseibium sp. Sym1]|uniref:DUF4166 domain-containing protein n=1 Tax=Roseibium sp. Sym1 TaxID=3016006 RepID=UPI0022B43A47|nr:DUF4166 domain-containing protein [Roseibium sp. Sym1]